MDFTDLEGWVVSFMVTATVAMLINTGLFIWSKLMPVSKVWREWQLSLLICQGVVCIILVVLSTWLIIQDHVI
jgi:hypothetical protein